jgi:hypothetical protein
MKTRSNPIVLPGTEKRAVVEIEHAVVSVDAFKSGLNVLAPRVLDVTHALEQHN